VKDICGLQVLFQKYTLIMMHQLILNDYFKIKIQSGPSFGIENQASCGYDRLHIRSIDDKVYGRICSSRFAPEIPFNGIYKDESFNGEKYKSKEFTKWLTLDTDHLG
jgi:hypothetical protein